MKKNQLALIYFALNICVIKTSGLAQCSANFSFVTGPGGTATLVSTSTGTNNSTSYFWGSALGGFTSGQPSNTYTFQDNAIFDVTLQITNSGTSTCSSVISKTIGIASAPCFSNISIIATSFTNGSVYFNSPEILYTQSNGYTYNWNFGNGTSSNLQNPIATYTNNAIYNVSLTAVSFSSICSYSSTISYTSAIITCSSLAANFSYTQNPGNNVLFKNPDVPTSPPINYIRSWNFNDGTGIFQSNTDTISHTFASTGTYSVQLAKYYYANFAPCSDSIIIPITVPNSTCSAVTNFSVTKDLTQALTWFATPNYPANINAAVWSWGDGSSSVGFYPTHTYSASGVYNICVAVSTSCGSTFSICNSSNIYRGQAEPMIQISVLSPKTVGIGKYKDDELQATINPNPNSGNFTLSISGLALHEDLNVKITDISGHIVFNQNFTNPSAENKTALSLDHLSAGMYFLTISSTNKTQTIKTVLTK